MLCEVCGQEPLAIVRYEDIPFIDGKYYEIVCHLCHSVPRTWEYDADGNVIYYGCLDPSRLASIETLMKEGWDKEEALCSINAIKKLTKNITYNVQPISQYFIYKKLFNMNIQLWQPHMALMKIT